MLSKWMRYIKLSRCGIFILVVMMLPCLAGNVIKDQFVIDSNGSSLGYRAPYTISEDQTILNDPDIEESVMIAAVTHINDNTIDVQLVREVSEVDYDHSTEIVSFDPPFNLMYEPNRIFVHLGSGFGNPFFASRRVYEDGSPTCFIHLRKSLWTGATEELKISLLIHEIMHCKGWEHPSGVCSIDDTYLNEDSLEILHRLYDSENTLNKVVVNIDKPEEDIISFLPAKRFRPQRTVCTSDSEVRLRKSKYKIKVNDRYIKKITKSGEVKYTQKIKKAKKFNLKNLEEFELIINQEE